MAKNNAHFKFEIADKVGYPAALIYSYIERGCEKYGTFYEGAKWRKIPLEEFCLKLHLIRRTAIRSLKLLIAAKLIGIDQKKGKTTCYRICQNVTSKIDTCQSVTTTSAKVSPPEAEKQCQSVTGPVPKCHWSENAAEASINAAMSENASSGTKGIEQHLTKGRGGVLRENLPSNAISSQLDKLFPPPLNDHNPTLETPEPEIPVPEHVKIFLGSWVRAIRKTLPSSRLSIGDMAQLTGRAAAQIGGTDEDVFDTVAYVSEVGSEHLRQVFFMNPGLIMSLNQYGYTYIEEARSKCVIWQKSVTAKRRFR